MSLRRVRTAVSNFRRSRDLDLRLAGAELRFRVDPGRRGRGLDNWLTRLATFTAAGEDMSQIHIQWGDHMLRSVEQTFAAEGRPAPWAPLAASTIEDRRRQGYGPGPILTRSGRLRSSFYVVRSRNRMRLGSRSPYMKYHQYGTRTMPQRVIVQMTEQDREEFRRIYRQHFGMDGR